MKNIFKLAITSALLGMTFVSCNDDFDDDFHYSHPGSVEIGYWANAQGEAKSYAVNFAKNDKGETYCEIIESLPDVGLSNVFADGKVTYNAAAGTMVVEFPKSPYNDSIKAMAEFTLRADNKTMFGKTYECTEAGKVSKSSTIVLGKCDSMAISGTFVIDATRKLVMNSDGSAEFFSDEKLDPAIFTQTGDSAKVVTESGKSFEVFNNDNGQVIFKDGEEILVLSRIVEKTVDDWQFIATGTYVSNGLELNIPNRQLIYSSSRKMAIIKDFYGTPGADLSFYWKLGESNVVFASGEYNTLTYLQDIVEYGYVYLQPTIMKGLGGGLVSCNGYEARFLGDGFIFGFNYQLPDIGQNLGFVPDLFLLDLEEEN